MKKSEFHDLSELDLNINLETGERNSSWGNLGFWSGDTYHSATYPQACEALAIKLGNFSNLNKLHPDSAIFDAGFGCGDQLLTWHKKFAINNITGVNISESQTELAKENTADINADTSTKINIQQGSACKKDDWPNKSQYERIIALDCIYHFSNKEQFFQLSKEHLKEMGKISITDLVLPNKKISWIDSLFLKIICFASHIPLKNLKTLEQYEKQLKTLDLTIEQQEDITTQVFMPFSKWVDRNIEQIQQHSPNLPRWKYKGTAFFLKYCAKKKILSYRLLNIARKKA